MQKTVVLDFHLPMLLENKIFNRELAYKISHTNLAICYLAEAAAKQGVNFITPDIYLQTPANYPGAILMSHQTSEFTQKVIDSGAKPEILICLESPYIATTFYMQLKKISGQFAHSFVFSGMKKRLSDRTVYHQMFYPQEFNIESWSAVPFSQKKFATMISGNKRLGTWKKDLALKVYYGLGVKNIYGQRFDVINFYASQTGFDLYGVGWDKGGSNQEESANIKKIYKGVVENKFETLKQYKFAFCFENSIFPGYITEKILDAFYAGTVPIYLGAPDVLQFVPKGCFVDFRDFADLEQLNKFLLSVDEAKYNIYLKNIKEFLQSAEYKRFDEKNFADQILNIISK